MSDKSERHTFDIHRYRNALRTYRSWGLTQETAYGRFWLSAFSNFELFGASQQEALKTLVSEAGLDLGTLRRKSGEDENVANANGNWPSTTGNPSGKGRGNNLAAATI
jgi:hypothetical protein